MRMHYKTPEGHEFTQENIQDWEVALVRATLTTMYGKPTTPAIYNPETGVLTINYPQGVVLTVEYAEEMRESEEKPTSATPNTTTSNIIPFNRGRATHTPSTSKTDTPDLAEVAKKNRENDERVRKERLMQSQKLADETRRSSRTPNRRKNEDDNKPKK